MILEVHDLVTGYDTGVVLDGTSLTVDRGECVAVLGRNGAGKTTLVRALAGVVPLRSGRVVLDGRDVGSWRTIRRIRAGLGVVRQGRGIFANLSVRENLWLGARTGRRAEGEAGFERIVALFPVLGERADSAGGTLSGGEQQMLALGRVLMGRPSVVVLDEPTTGLAPIMIERIFENFRDLFADDAGLLLIEQNAAVALRVADRCLVLSGGRVGYEATAVTARDDPGMLEAFLGSESAGIAT